MFKKMMIVILLLVLLPSASAYNALITVTATLNNYKGEPLTGYGARVRIYNSVPNSQNLDLGMIADSVTQDSKQKFTSFTKYISLTSETTYYITLKFVGLCSKDGLTSSSGVSHPSNCVASKCPPSKGACWGFCTPGEYNNIPTNIQRNIITISACNDLGRGSSERVLGCTEIPDIPSNLNEMQQRTCNAPRDDQFNPVYPTTTSPGEKPVPLILGITPLISFTG